MMASTKVLIVEDEAIVSLHLERIVAEMGLQVAGTAATAAEAIAQAEREPPELALIDIRLDGEGDGIDAAWALRRRHDCAVVFATAYADEETIARTVGLGAAGYVVKPFTSAGIRAAIATALAGRGDQERREESLVGAPAPSRRVSEGRPVVSRNRPRRFGAGTRMLFYSHDTFGLGHLQRSTNLIRTLLREYPEMSALLVTGSPVVHRYELPEGADYVKLPAVRKVAADQYEARSLRIESAGIQSLRENLLLRTVRDYDPQVLLVDHAPLGMKGELRPALEWLAENGGCRRILGLRDITDAPDYVIQHWREQGIYDAMRDLYDDIVVYGSPDVYDLVTEYALPTDVAAKTHFLGYVREPDGVESVLPALSGRPAVAVSIGGGDGADGLIDVVIEMVQAFPEEVGFHIQILTGPLVGAERQQEFRERARGLPVEVFEFMQSTSQWFGRADLVVSTGGYNTVTQLLAHARRAIVVPRVLHRQEQLIRARRLEELGLAACLHPQDLTPRILLDAIRDALAREEEPLAMGRAAGLIALDGAERMAAFCGALELS